MCHLLFPVDVACFFVWWNLAQVKVRSVSEGDTFLVLASDGVWEFMNNTEVSVRPEVQLGVRIARN